MTPSQLFAPLTFVLLIMTTACHTTLPPNKSTTSTIQNTYIFESHSRQNTPALEITCERIEHDKNKFIFNGEAKLKRELVNFLADHISLEFDENGRMNGVVEMKGNVSMSTPAELTLKSEKAISSDFRTHIDFIGNVSITNKGYRYNTDWVRYYFFTEKMQFKFDDNPMRGHRITDEFG